MTGYAYMTASQKRGTIYIGVTNDLGRRMPEHNSGQGSRFTSRYGVQRLVWYEEHFDIRDAIQREPMERCRSWLVDILLRGVTRDSAFLLVVRQCLIAVLVRIVVVFLGQFSLLLEVVTDVAVSRHAVW
jgi:putative endonuclease